MMAGHRARLQTNARCLTSARNLHTGATGRHEEYRRPRAAQHRFGDRPADYAAEAADAIAARIASIVARDKRLGTDEPPKTPAAQ